jgi:DNA modification methylase
MAVTEQEVTPKFALYNGDSCEVLQSLPKESVGCSVYSPPFGDLYAYSNDERDMSNCKSHQEFMDHYGFLVGEILRTTKPGRLSCVHCMDLKQGENQRDFPGDIIRLHESLGFHFYGRVTIWKDPWLVARRTRMRTLMHKMIVEDSSKARPAGADYVLFFKKPGNNPDPIAHPVGLSRYAGGLEVPPHLVAKFGTNGWEGDQRTNRLSHWIWRRYAAPVWDDIRSGRLLPYKEARETEEEKHVCPLQLDVIERCLTLYSNPGDVVLSPFGGVGSEPYVAVQMARKAVAIELKPTYYRQMVANVKEAENKPLGYGEEDFLDGIEMGDDEEPME